MHRRHLLAVLAACATAGVRAQDAPRPRHRISAATLHAALAQRFPLRLGIEGLLAVEVDAPRLLLLPARNRLGAGLRAQLAGDPVPGLPPGEADVLFALRYEASDRSIRAREPELADLRWPGLPPETVQVLRQVLPGLARDALGEVVLHRFTAADLALPDAMGFVPGALTVQGDGVVVDFVPGGGR